MTENFFKYLIFKFEFIYFNSNEIDLTLISFTKVKFKIMTPRSNIIFLRRLYLKIFDFIIFIR